MTVTVSDADFAALAQFMAREAGLVFDASRRPALTSVVLERMAETRATAVMGYLAYISLPEGAEERQRLLDGVTIQETHFFRNGAQIESLRDHLLPDVIRRAAAERRPVRIWSAGCSTGEEPYTLAMLALEVRDALRLSVDIVILGTDVSAAAIDVAERAEYAGRTTDLAEEGALDRWFDRVPDGGETFRVRDDVRDTVTFQVHNLVSGAPPFADGMLDLVVCRNVTIYFARDTTRALVERFHDVLRPNGYLLLGHAETLWQVSDAFALVPVAEAFAYRKEMIPVPSALESMRAMTPLLAPAAPVAPTGAGSRSVREVRAHSVAANAARTTRRASDPLLAVPTAATERAAVRPRVRSTGVDALIAARQAWAEGRYQQVVDLAGRATSADPLLTDAYILGGQASSTLGDDAGALEALRKAVYLEPSAGHAHFLLAGALARLGQPGPAARSFRAAAASLPLVPPEQVRFLLDGRDVGELVALCDQLADASERAATASGRSTR